MKLSNHPSGFRDLLDRAHLAFIHHDERIGHIEIAIVMRDDHDSLASGSQGRKHLPVKDFLERGILIRSPLIEEIEILVFDKRSNESHASPLPIGQRERGEPSVPIRYFL